MPHEFNNLPNLSHDALGFILVGGLASAALIIGLGLFLGWKHRRKHRGGRRLAPPKPRKTKDRKR
jgi:hypothetical protein